MSVIMKCGTGRVYCLTLAALLCLCATSTAIAQTTGACCERGEGICLEPLTEAQCVDPFYGGFYLGDGSTCSVGPLLGGCGACCDTSTGTCSVVTGHYSAGECSGSQEDFFVGQPCAEITCRVECGDNARGGGEECDGSDAIACPGLCQADCMCPGRSNRYIVLRAPNGPDQGVYVRITLTSLDRFHAFDGQNRYLSPAMGNYPNEGGSPASFLSTNLVCSGSAITFPWSWSLLREVFIHGPEIVPNSTYTVRIMRVPDFFVLHQYTLTTGKWGDIVAPFGTNQPDFSDISAMVDKFRALPTAPPKTRTQLQPNDPLPWMPVSFSDISACVDAFRGVLYPMSGPTACP